jgi:DNA-directed RNA polymerase subunit RPC12/RpoP
VADVSSVYKCGKCNRNFSDPYHLKNHEFPCRGRRPVEEVALMPRRQAEKNLAGHFLNPRTIEFRRGPETHEFE